MLDVSLVQGQLRFHASYQFDIDSADVLARMLEYVANVELPAETLPRAPAGATLYPWLDDPSQWGTFRHEGTET